MPKKKDGRGIQIAATTDGLDKAPPVKSTKNPKPRTTIQSGGIQGRKKKGST